MPEEDFHGPCRSELCVARSSGGEGNPDAPAGSVFGVGRAQGPNVFPRPQEMELSQGHFTLDVKAVILLPNNSTAASLPLARFLIEELSDRYDLQARAGGMSYSARMNRIASISEIMVRRGAFGFPTTSVKGYNLRRSWLFPSLGSN